MRSNLRVFLGLVLALLPAVAVRAQSATLVTTLTATQGQVLTYTAVLTNGTGSNYTGLMFSAVLDPNTTLVAGSVNTSPLALPETYSVLGNVSLTVPAPGVLANDVDPDGIGPALTATVVTNLSVRGGNVVIGANGAFTYNPPPGYEGADSFTYTLNDGEGFTDTGTVSLTVTGMIWYVTASGPVGDGRLSAPFNSLSAFAGVNNGVSNNPAAGDNIFLYSGSYSGGLTLLNNQRLIGQGATASLSVITGLTPPPNSPALPATGGARPVLGGSIGVTLAAGNALRGLNCNHSGGTSLLGASVGALALTEMGVTNSSGPALNLTSGALNVSLGAVRSIGGANGIRLVNCTGSFTVTGDGALAQNGSGGTILNSTGNGVHLDNVVNVSLARMNIDSSLGNGVFGQTVNGFVLDWCSLANNGDAVDEAGLRLGDPLGANGLIGSGPAGANPTRIANTLLRASGEMNAAIFNNGGTLTQLEVTNVVSKDTRTRPLGADGFLFEVRGSGVATVNFSSCSFSNNFTQGIQASALAQSVLSVTVTNCGFTNNNEGIVLANANDADITYDLNGNRFFNNLATGASGAAIAAVNATTVTTSAIYSGKIRNNTVSGGGIDNHLVTVLLAGAGMNTLAVQNNNINAPNSQFSGLFLQAGETGSGNLTANATVTANTVTLGALGSHGILVQSRITSTLCAEMANNVSTTAGVGLFGITVRQRDTSTFRLPTFAGPFNSAPAVIAFVQGKNAGSTVNATVATAYSGGAACTLPLLVLPREAQPDSNLQPTMAGNEWPATVAPTLEARHDAQASSAHLTPAALAPIISAARQGWADTGLAAEQLAVIDSLRFEVTDLAGWYLGASSNRLVRLDRRANGHGWFIDPTPNDDAEFSGDKSSRIDLLTAVLHEMGHNLGLADEYSPASRASVMHGFLTPGERRRPLYAQAREAAPDDGAHIHYMFTPLNIGTLPPGKSITITFSATVANPMPAGVCVVTNQGLVTANGGISFPTDDPRTGALLDATLTTILVPPAVTTLPATAITGTSATLNGTINPCGTAAGWFFQYGTTTNFGSVTATTSTPAGLLPLAVNAPIAGLTAGSLYYFRLVATNAAGTNRGAILSFVTPLTLVQQPTNAAACAGGTASFSVGASSSGVTYQWQRRSPGAGSFAPIANATNQTYTTPPLTIADDGARYRAIVSTAATNLTSTEALLAVISIGTPTVTYDFNSGLPPNTAIYGHAFLSNGVLELNTNAPGQAGAFLTADLAPGRFVRGFTAAFKARLLAGTAPPADGFSFNWATDLPNGAYASAEEGEGSGLRVNFDTYDNGFGEGPAIDVYWNTNLVARRSVTSAFLVRGASFIDVKIRLTSDGLLDVTYGCESIFARLPVTGYAPQLTARFGLGGRTGGLWETHGIDDLALQLDLDPTNGPPRITSVARQTPAGLLITGVGTAGLNCTVEASTDFSNWVWRATVPISGGGVWQYLESNITTPPYRFYRARGASQFPAGLMNWWRAETNYLDSFGGLPGTPINGLAFTNGQRGRAFNFDGTTHYLHLGGAPLPVPWTACFWVYRKDGMTASAALIADAATGLKLEQAGSPNRALGFTQFGVADYYFTNAVPTNVWTHVTFAGTTGGTILYLNGVPRETNAATVALPRFTLGARPVPNDLMNGQLDEVTLFNRALTPAEIQQVRNATRGP